MGGVLYSASSDAGNAPTGKVLDARAVGQILEHLNADHAADNLLIVRALAGLPDARQAVATGVDGHGIDFLADVGDDSVATRLRWLAPIQERAEVRTAVVALYDQARRVLARPPS